MENPEIARGERSGSQTTRAVMQLREMLFSGEIPPGTRLSELAIVERLGMSRTPVRAALTMLAEEGLLQPIGTGGFSSRSFSERDVNDAIELRGTLEGLAARFAAERGISTIAGQMLGDLLARLDEVVTAPKLDPDVMEQYIELNARFHREIIRLAESRVVERQIERVMALPFASPSAFVMAQARSEDARKVLIIAQDQHRAVVEAIIGREGARADALMREHSRVARRNLGQAVRSREALEQVPGGKLIQFDRYGED